LGAKASKIVKRVGELEQNCERVKSKVETNIETQQSNKSKWEGQGFDPGSGQRQETQPEQERHQRQTNVVIHHSPPLRCLLVPNKHNYNTS
jgi:hypothetical protein